MKNGILSRLAPAALLTAVAVSIACDGSSSVNLNASAIAIVSGNGQAGVVGLALTSPLVVKVTNSDGDPIDGAVVTFTVTGGGTLGTDATTTDADGKAQTTLVLGLVLGAQTVTASAQGLTSTVTFTATASVSATQQIVVVSGNNQSATRNTSLAAPLVVKVQDANGTALPGVTVLWTSSAGAVSSASTVTGADGKTQINFTLPNAAGENTVTAKISGTTTAVAFTATGG